MPFKLKKEHFKRVLDILILQEQWKARKIRRQLNRIPLKVSSNRSKYILHLLSIAPLSGAFRPPSVKQLPSINSGHMPQLLGGVSQLQSLEGKINKKVFDKPITGDIFGSFMSGNQSFVDSLMYRARLTKVNKSSRIFCLLTF